MISVIRTIFYFGPLFFGFGFLAPLIAQSIVALGWAAPFGLSPLVFGLLLGGGYGLVAQVRGRWI
ncbi:MAG: hypothetical protein AAGI03_03695 [Pseudomonadota bacterium]